MKRALRAALAAWGAEAPQFISESENAVYKVTCGGRPAALRLHRPGYQGRAEIWSELWWLDALAARGLSVPAPLPGPDGALVVELPGGRLASMVSWVSGVPMPEAGRPLTGSRAAQSALFFRIGQTLARLHNITDRLTLPETFVRHAWDVEGLMGEAPFWGRFWQNPTLSPDERGLILRAREVARARLDRFRAAGGDFGLIHADAIRGNIFFSEDSVTLIDFDDAGFGFRLYDLAVLMTQNEGLPNTAALQAAAIAGYRSARPLPAEAEALLPVLVMARRFASMGWIVPRSAPDSPLRRIYAERALAAAERLLP